MFASRPVTGGGPGHEAVWVNAPLGVQGHLVATDPERYFVPPYVGVKGWVGVDLAAVSDADLLDHVTDSYCIVAPKKLVATLSAD
jgi:hypothetical protein